MAGTRPDSGQVAVTLTPKRKCFVGIISETVEKQKILGVESACAQAVTAAVARTSRDDGKITVTVVPLPLVLWMVSLPS
jgi:hypothetical protein